MTALLYLVGQAAAGKTTLCHAATAKYHATRLTIPITAGARTYNLPLTAYGPGWRAGDWYDLLELGQERGQFGGTDTFARDSSRAVLELLRRRAARAREEQRPVGGIIGEGDRLAYPRFFEGAEAMGYTVTVAMVNCAGATCTARQAARGQRLIAQEQTHRMSRYAGVAARWGCEAYTFDGARPVSENLQLLGAHPVFTWPTDA